MAAWREAKRLIPRITDSVKTLRRDAVWGIGEADNEKIRFEDTRNGGGTMDSSPFKRAKVMRAIARGNRSRRFDQNHGPAVREVFVLPAFPLGRG